MIIHLVFFKVKEQPDLETVKQDIINSLKDVPGPLKPMQFSSPISDARAKGLNFGFVAYFKDRDALRAYDVSDAHQSAVENTIKSRIEDFLDYDIDVPDGTPFLPNLWSSFNSNNDDYAHHTTLMNTTSSRLTSFSLFSPGLLAAATLDRAVDLHSMDSANYSSMERMVDGGGEDARADYDTTMNTPSSSQTPDLSRSESAIFPNDTQASSQSSASNQPTSTVSFPKPPVAAQFSSNLIPPTPPTMTTPPSNNNNAAGSPLNPKSSPRLTRPQLTSRMSSRAGGKRHASIGSQREIPFVLPPSSTSTGTTVPTAESPTPSQTTTSGDSVVSQTWNRLREMGLHVPGRGSPAPKTPKSGSSGATSPRSPEEHRAMSYFSYRRRSGSGAALSPGKAARSSAATPPPPPPPPPPPAPTPVQAPKLPPGPSPISEESTPLAESPRYRRANLSLDLGSTLAQRGSTASLPLVGHTPVSALIQQTDPKSGRPSMVLSPPPAPPPPHIHTPPVQPPAYEYPFLPNHAPRRPLDVRVEEVLPAGGAGQEGGSWAITVRLPGFNPDGITIGTRRGRVLVIVADNYNDGDDGAGHFERRISFGYDADMANIRAEFNGDMLRVTVPRRAMFGLMSLG
ncbi:hypothetical protein FRC07_008160, partial [Ceratobasidium sp. 392]